MGEAVAAMVTISAGADSMALHGALLGTFCLMSAEPHEWTRRDLYILATLAKLASSEIAVHRLRAEAAAARQ
jgi:GAF domain-containing protein